MDPFADISIRALFFVQRRGLFLPSTQNTTMV